MTRSFLERLIINWLPRFEKINRRFSRCGEGPFFDPHDFPWIAPLEANWQTIRGELDPILPQTDSLPNFQDISPEQIFLTEGNRWKTFFLYGYGYAARKNCRRCPQTAALLKKIPGMKTAFFSILKSGKHIPKHRGPYNGVLRLHLGLKIPREILSCRIEVGGETQFWSDGKSLVFDDTYPHEVWNESDEDRVILFVDFVRPLFFPVSLLNRIFIRLLAFSPFVQKARQKQEEWERLNI